MKYEDRFTEQEENMQAPWWSEWAKEAERMDQIAKKEKEEILAWLEVWKKENRDEELELEKKQAKETTARRKEDAPNASPRNGELTEITLDDETTE